MRSGRDGNRRPRTAEVPVMRTIPEITRTYTRDVERHAELLAAARRGEADEADIRELSLIDGELHRFGRMCRRWAPLSLTELGFMWGETIRKQDDPDVTFIIRETALVHFEGEDMLLTQVCTTLAARGVRVSVGGWMGSAGTVADLAGLRHPATDTRLEKEGDEDAAMAASRPQEHTDRKSDGIQMTAPAVSDAPKKEKKSPAIGGNYDLFG